MATTAWKQSRKTNYRLTQGVTPLVLLILLVAGWWWADSWQYDRAALQAGEYWRWLSAHLAHGTPAHGLSNAVAVLLAALLAPLWMNRWPGLLLAAALMAGVSAGIWFNNDDIDIYRGFSGVGHGWLMVAFAWSPWLGVWPRFAIVVAILLKVVWEDSGMAMAAQFSGYFADAPVLIDAHWYGVLLAVPLALAAFFAQYLRELMLPRASSRF